MANALPAPLIVYSRDPVWKLGLKLPPRQRHEGVASLRELALFLADHYDAVGMAVALSSDPADDAQAVSLARRLSPQLPIILVGERTVFDQLPESVARAKATWSPDGASLAELFKPVKNRRQFYRLEWPLGVQYSSHFNMTGHRPGKIITLSAGGASVLTRDLGGLAEGQDLFLRVYFEHFVFFVESRIVRVSPLSGAEPGFAVAFQRITPATAGIIKDILRDQMVQVLGREFPLLAASAPPVKVRKKS